MHDFTKLKVWFEARGLTKRIYETTARFPDRERFGLTSQMQRAAVSITSNIAEGAARGTSADFRRYLRMAAGSASELQSQLYMCRDVGLLQPERADELIDAADHIRNMLFNLERSHARPNPVRNT
jgi:four helix bundle protein